MDNRFSCQTWIDMTLSPDLDRGRDVAISQFDFADWLFFKALPLWSDRGRDSVGGGFHDALCDACLPTSAAKRLRVQARQIFVFAQAGSLGWDGPWRAAMRHGADFLVARLLRDDGLFRPVPLQAAPDRPAGLYDQAFALLALACLHRHHPSRLWRETAIRLIGELEARHGSGWTEPGQRGPTVSTNSLMHLFEAMLAWCACMAGDPFDRHARAIRTAVPGWLAQSSEGKLAELIDPDTGCPIDAEHAQCWIPGHHYEWAFLLKWSAQLLGGNVTRQTKRLVEVAELQGLSGTRVVLSQHLDGRPREARARLWSQTERMRAVLFCSEAFGEGRDAALKTSASVVADFLGTAPAGLWRDEGDLDGTALCVPTPASSLYHIIGTLAHLPELGGGRFVNGGFPA